MNFKEKLLYLPLPLGGQYLPSVEHLSSLGQDLLGNDLCFNDLKNIYSPNDGSEAESIPKVDAPLVPPPLHPLRAS